MATDCKLTPEDLFVIAVGRVLREGGTEDDAVALLGEGARKVIRRSASLRAEFAAREAVADADPRFRPPFMLPAYLDALHEYYPTFRGGAGDE